MSVRRDDTSRIDTAVERTRLRPVVRSDHQVAELPLSQRAYEAIKGAIIAQGLPPGRLLSQKELAEEYGVGLTPVREALIRLEQEGFVRIIARRGALIAEVSADDLDDVLVVRSALEGAAAQAAAGQVPRDALSALRRAMDEAEAMGDEDTLYAVGSQVHELILRHCGYQRLVRLVSEISAHIARYSVLASRLPDQAARSARGHRAILEALASGDGVGARRAVQAHIGQMREELHEALALQSADALDLQRHPDQPTSEGNIRA